MSKPLNPTPVEYCWLTKELWQFNVRQDEGPFIHTVVLFFNLHNEEKTVLGEHQVKVKIAESDNMLTINQIATLRQSIQSKTKIMDKIVEKKEELSGYILA